MLLAKSAPEGEADEIGAKADIAKTFSVHAVSKSSMAGARPPQTPSCLPRLLGSLAAPGCRRKGRIIRFPLFGTRDGKIALLELTGALPGPFLVGPSAGHVPGVSSGARPRSLSKASN